MPQKWPQVKEILASALERSPGERADFVRQACGEDSILRAEIESLLANYDGADGLLEESPANLFSFSVAPMIGRQIGAYRILQETGQGGMAVVYLAERADHEFRKHVAIKMVKPGGNSEEIIRRFRNERQTLAALDHPHIVKLLDGGSTEEGWPYLVMDFVEGVRIDRYCDTHRLSVRERLELFQAVCQIVHYAHRHMVIHRDLKPSNILIDGEGVPRLLDFGIAKLLNPECFQAPLVTTGNWRPMTPEYASPEQVRGEPVTNAADVYSLGVLLYELLAGRRPYRATVSTWAEVERLVCEVEPIKPSVVIDHSEIDRSQGEAASASKPPRPAITPEMVSAARRTTPDELRRQLQGDLDNIVMMAVRKEPHYRYASAEEFANDIERHLSNMPVKARRPTAAYRGGKFLRRHREAVAAVVVVLALATGLSLWQAHRVRNQASPAATSAVARPSGRTSVAILGFKNLSSGTDTAWLSTAFSEMLTTELAAGEKLRTVPGETVARTKIDLSLSDADSLASDTLDRVRRNLGSDFVVVGSYLVLSEGARSEIRLDVRLQDTAKGETVATISETGTENNLLQLVSRSGARLREHLGAGGVPPDQTVGTQASIPSNPEAMRLYAQGLVKLRAFDALAARDLLIHAVAADPSFPLAHSALAKAWQTLGYDANAAQESKTALQLATKLSREDHLLVEARYYESVAGWDTAVDTYHTLFGFFPDNLEYGIGLALAQARAGKGKDTLATLEALEQSSAQAQDDPRIDLAKAEAASTLSDNQLQRDAGESAAAKAEKLGAKLLQGRALALECRALANLSEFDKATGVCEAGRRIYSETVDRGGLARMLHAMAETPLDKDDLATAEKLYRQALSLTQAIGDKHGNGRELGNLAIIYQERGDFAGVLAVAKEALKNFQEAGDKAGIAAVTGNLGTLFHHQGRLGEALKYYETSLAQSNAVGNKSSAAVALANMAEVLRLKGDLSTALKKCQQALSMQRELGQKYYEADNLGYIGEILRQQGDVDGARSHFMEALAVQEQIGEKGGAAGTRLALVELAWESGKTADAEALARVALGTLQELKDTDGQMVAESVLARLLIAQGKLAQARESIAAALPLAEKSKDVIQRTPIAIDHVYLLAAEKNFAGAEQLARQTIAQARKLGLVQYQLEATLALGEAQMKENKKTAGRAKLAELEKAARKLGFEFIARKAAMART
jgi:serine/threonine protein kinase/tetratricopeptide (TPR) repeat protein/TolB-like protein